MWTPSTLRVLDYWLLTHHPRLWATRLHYVLLCSAVACVIGAAAGMAIRPDAEWLKELERLTEPLERRAAALGMERHRLTDAALRCAFESECQRIPDSLLGDEELKSSLRELEQWRARNPFHANRVQLYGYGYGVSESYYLLDLGFVEPASILSQFLAAVVALLWCYIQVRQRWDTLTSTKAGAAVFLVYLLCLSLIDLPVYVFTKFAQSIAESRLSVLYPEVTAFAGTIVVSLAIGTWIFCRLGWRSVVLGFVAGVVFFVGAVVITSSLGYDYDTFETVSMLAMGVAGVGFLWYGWFNTRYKRLFGSATALFFLAIPWIFLMHLFSPNVYRDVPTLLAMWFAVLGFVSLGLILIGQPLIRRIESRPE